MAQFKLYIDTDSGELVANAASTKAGLMPRFTQGDTMSLRIYLLARSATWPDASPYDVVNNAALTLNVALGPKNGTSGSVLYTQQFTWSKDGQNQYFYADFPLNTAGISSLINTAESAQAWFEVEYVQNGVPTTVLQKSVTVNGEVIETTSLTVPAGQEAATLAYVNATFLKADNNGFVMTNPTTGGKVQVYLGDDGTVHFDPIA